MVGGVILYFGVIIFASWCVGEGADVLGEVMDGSILGGLIVASLNTGM